MEKTEIDSLRKSFGAKVRSCVVIEAAEIIGPSETRSLTANFLMQNGWRIVHSGPYTNKRMWPKVDPDRYLFNCEREIAIDDAEEDLAGK